MSENKYLTVEDLSEELHMSIRTIRNRLSRGDAMPPSIKIGRRRLFPASQFHDWMLDKVSTTEFGFLDEHDNGFAKYRT